MLALTLAGHAGGPSIDGRSTRPRSSTPSSARWTSAGWETAHIVGNSLGGYVALQLAARGRARTVVALAPAGGWAEGDESFRDALAYFTTMQALLRDGRAARGGDRRDARGPAARVADRRPSASSTSRPSCSPTRSAAPRPARLRRRSSRTPRSEGWSLDAERIECPVRVVWGTDDKLLHWPSAAARYREQWLPHADWVELEGVGHCPQLDVPLETTELIARLQRSVGVPGACRVTTMPPAGGAADGCGRGMGLQPRVKRLRDAQRVRLRELGALA